MADLLLWSFVFIFALNILGLIYCYTKQSDTLTDISYGLSFFITSAALLVYEGTMKDDGNVTTAKITLTVMILIWSARLGGYLLYRIHQMKNDKRFDGMRENFGQIARFWILQAATVWLMMLPSIFFMRQTKEEDVYWKFSGGEALNITMICQIFGCVTFTLAFILETVADQQKYAYKTNPENKGKFCDVGVWRWCQHPNYFAEIVIWWSLFIFCAPVLEDYEWFALISPVWITLLLLFVSGIPLLRKQWDKKYGTLQEYQLYRKHTSVLIPCCCCTGND